MKNFEAKYKKLIDEVDLNNQEYSEIKRNVITNNKKTFGFKLKYALLLIMLFISVIGVANADKIIKHYKIVTNDNKSFEESGNRSFISNSRIEKDFSKEILKKDTYYTYDDIEDKLNLKFLKNNYLKSDLFLLRHLDIERNMIAKASFELVNEDKTEPKFSIIIETNYLTEDSGLTIKGGKVSYEEYYIQNLNTEAIIVKYGEKLASNVIVELSYDNILYELQFDMVNFNDEKQVEKLYDFLDSFTTN